jgi:hypothetical protein
VLLAVVEDLLRGNRADAGQCVELVSRGRVQVDRAGADPWCRPTCPDAAGPAPRNDDLLAVRDRGGEIHEFEVGGTRRSAGACECIRNA